MKFSTYIQQQQSLSLTPESKELIYKRFEAKKRQKLFVSKALRYTRVSAFWGLVIVVVGVAYLWSFGGKEVGTREVGEWLVQFNIDKTKQVSYADEIWQIIETTGEVKIFANGKQKQASYLISSDKVLLLEWAALVFRVQDGVEAKIVWPAEFELDKSWDVYVINMLSGEYVELKSVEIEVPKTDRSFVLDQPNPLPKNVSVKVLVKTVAFEVESDSAAWDIDMTITGKEWTQVVENVGVDVIITKVIKDEKVVTQLKSKQTASINEEVEVLDMSQEQILDEEEALVLAELIKNQDLVISYTLDSEEKNDDEQVVDTQTTDVAPAPLAKTGLLLSGAGVILWTGVDIVVGTWVLAAVSSEGQDTYKLLDSNSKDEEQSIHTNIDSSVQQADNEQIPPSVDIQEVADKRVIDDINLVAIQSATESTRLMNHLRSLVMSQAYGNDRAKQSSLVSLSDTLSPISQQVLWGMALDTSSSLALSASLSTMIINLESKRYIPPIYIRQIKSVIAWLRLVDTLPAWSVETSCDFYCVTNDVLKIPESQKGYLML
jgi:hypothetical protein